MIMNTLSLKDKLTIVIPSKNEGVNIYECIGFISKQRGIQGTKVVIADVSDEDKSLAWIQQTQIDFKYSLNIEVIKGGYPAQGRLNGSKLVKTPYMLFLDADVMIINPAVIPNIMEYKKDLMTVPFSTDTGWNWAYWFFDRFQWLSKLMGTPFAVGGFQLWNTETYWKVGGYNPEELFAEDYSISQKVISKNFMVYKTKYVYTSARRFKNKGVLWMFKIMIKSYLNRNNPEFFKKSHGYWQ
jgi:glycosyltransferase involved in cell wall biosynthesis